MSIYALMENFYNLQRHSFAHVLQAFLDETGVSKSELYEYLWQQGYCIEKTSMYKYFSENPKVTRLPEALFIQHFTTFLELSPEQTRGLFGVWELKHHERAGKRRAKNRRLSILSY